jgi:hypothetical protein
MDEFIHTLTHDNDYFMQHWSDIVSSIQRVHIPDECRLVLKSLADYVCQEPVHPSACDVKYTMITMVLKRLATDQALIEIDDLVHVFVRCFDEARIDRWYLHFLTNIYRLIKFDTQSNSVPIRIDLIEQILNSLQKKHALLDSNGIHNEWVRFLTHTLLTDRTKVRHSLNQANIIEMMPSKFQEFYR